MPIQLTENMPNLAMEIRAVEFDSEQEDTIIWSGSRNGELTMKTAYEYYREKCPMIQWEKNIWRAFLPPKISLLVWKILRRRIATSDRLRRRGMHTGGVCLRCIQGTLEDENHIFIYCQNAKNLWEWVSQLIGEDITRFTEISELIRWSVRLPKKNQCCQSILALIFCGIWELWVARNSIIFNGVVVNEEQCVNTVRRWVQKLSFMFNGNCSNTTQELQLLKFLNAKPNFKRELRSLEVLWRKPFPGWYKLNTDGVALGQPGNASGGGI